MSGRAGEARGEGPGPRHRRPGRSFTIRRLVTQSKTTKQSVVVALPNLHERGPFASGSALSGSGRERRANESLLEGAAAASRDAAMAAGTSGSFGPRMARRPSSLSKGARGPGRRGQAPKGTGGMPRRHQHFRAWKAAISPGELPNERRSRNARRDGGN